MNVPVIVRTHGLVTWCQPSVGRALLELASLTVALEKLRLGVSAR